MIGKYHPFNGDKILVHAEKLRRIAEGGLPLPVAWHFFPSNVCNHKCVWCMYRQNGEQFENAVKIPCGVLMRGVEDAARTGAVMVRFTGGGEPLLNRYTPDAMERAKELGLTVLLDTNGTRLSPGIARNADRIRLSLNAGTAKQHWKTNHGSDARDPGDWERIIQNVRDVLPTFHDPEDFGFGFVCDHENVHDIVPFVGLAAELGVGWVHIRPAFWYDHNSDEATHKAMEQALAYCNEARRLYADRVAIYAITDKFDGFWTPRTYSRCHAVKFETVLTATGDFAVCLDRMDMRFGAAYKEGASFEDVWYSKEHIALMDTIVSPGVLDACPRCVWNNRNIIVEEVFMKDKMRLNVI